MLSVRRVWHPYSLPRVRPILTACATRQAPNKGGKSHARSSLLWHVHADLRQIPGQWHGSPVVKCRLTTPVRRISDLARPGRCRRLKVGPCGQTPGLARTSHVLSSQGTCSHFAPFGPTLRTPRGDGRTTLPCGYAGRLHLARHLGLALASAPAAYVSRGLVPSVTCSTLSRSPLACQAPRFARPSERMWTEFRHCFSP